MKYLLLLLIIFSSPKEIIFRHPANIISNSCIEILNQFRAQHFYQTSNLHFNQLFLNYSPKDITKRSFGIETEFLIPMDVNKDGVADFLEVELKQLYPDIQIKRAAYTQRVLEYEDYGKEYKIITLKYTQNGVEKKWIISPELLFPPGHYEICEISTPVMTSERELQVFTQLLDKLKKQKGAKEWPRSAGVHIHYGVPELEESELRLIYYSFLELNDDLVAHFNKAPTRTQNVFDLNSYRSTLEKRFEEPDFSFLNDERIVQNKITTMRYSPELGTMEFRMINSTLDKTVITYSYQLYHAIIDAIRSQNAAFLDYLADCHARGISARLQDIGEILKLDFLNSPSFRATVDRELREAL